jgi:tetratricopeptide (TPR) repeat protein
MAEIAYMLNRNHTKRYSLLGFISNLVVSPINLMLLKKILRIAPLLFLYTTTVSSQDIRHYKNIIDTKKNNFIKLKSLDSILSKFLKKGSTHSSLDLKEAVKNYTLALENFSKKDSIYIADTYLFRAQAYSSLGNFVAAGADYNKAYLYYENLKDYKYMLHAQQGNITMFSMNGFYELAKKSEIN